jgi:hypothetical protein
MPYAVVPVPSSEVIRFWSAIAKLLQPAIDRSEGRCTAGQVLDLAMAGSSQVWLVVNRDTKEFKAAALTNKRPYVGDSYINVSLIGGIDMAEWLDVFISDLKAYAKHNQCVGIEFLGRRGWVKTLKKYGFTPKDTVFMDCKID